MKLVANYEIKTECSIVDDEHVLKIKHPKDRYSVHIQNITRTVYTTPFLLSLNLYFEAPELKGAQEIADTLLTECLNMLAFATGSKFKRHRIYKIVDATPQAGMRDILMWGDTIEYEDPQPFITEENTSSIEKLLEFDVPPAISRAMRWYRLGINAPVLDDQFMNFWFALEIIAEFQKSPEKVPDKCTKCQSPLYCESCKRHPVHKPFAKQAIQSLLKVIDKKCDDEVIKRLEDTRNSLMHGSTLKEIEDKLPQPHEQIVDVLGRLVWKALIHQFPKEMFNKELVVGYPSTYINHTINTICHMQTIVPKKPNGDLDLRSKGVTAGIKPFGPPQSALPSIIKMSVEQLKQLQELSYNKGEHQEMCQRICQRTKKKDNNIYAQILSTDMALIHKALKKGETGIWQNLFREIMSNSSTKEPVQ